jgi:hypothetical protein
VRTGLTTEFNKNGNLTPVPHTSVSYYGNLPVMHEYCMSLLASWKEICVILQHDIYVEELAFCETNFSSFIQLGLKYKPGFDADGCYDIKILFSCV